MISIYIISLFNTHRDPRGCEAPQMTKCLCIHTYDLMNVISTECISLPHTHGSTRLRGAADDPMFMYITSYILSLCISSLSHTHRDPRGCKAPQMTRRLWILSHTYHLDICYPFHTHTGIHAAARRLRRPDVNVYYLIYINSYSLSLYVLSLYILSFSHTHRDPRGCEAPQMTRCLCAC